MCDNLMSEAQRTVMEKVGSNMKLKEAVEGVVQEGRAMMKRHKGRSVEELNDDSEYSNTLHEAVQVRALPFPQFRVEAESGTSCDQHRARVAVVG